jgi:hypothetical protein
MCPSIVFYNKILETFNAQIAAIIVGPLYIIYITTCLAWLRTGR